MKCHDEFLCREPPDSQPQAGPHIGNATRSPSHFLLQVPLRYTYSPRPASGWPKQAFFALPQGPEAEDPGCEPQIPPSNSQYPGHRADSPPLAGPGCARPPWLPAGAPKPSSFSMPAISLSCWAKKAAAGSSSAASGAPLSDDEKKPKSSAIFPASLPKRPSGARLCPARAPRCARRPRHCHPSTPGGAARPRRGRAQRGGPTLPLRHRARLACHCGCRREEPGRECGDVTGRGRRPAGRPEVASQRPQEGGSRTAAQPQGPGAALPARGHQRRVSRTQDWAAPAGSGGEADGTKGPSRVQGHRRLAARISGAPSGWSQRNLAPPDSFCTSFFSKARRVL